MSTREATARAPTERAVTALWPERGPVYAALLTLLVALAAAMAPASAQTAATAIDIDAKLIEADRVRTSDRARFAALLSELDATAATATQAQRMKLRLMHAHHALISGKFQSAIDQLKQMQESVEDPQLRYRAGALLANTYAITRQFADALRSLDVILPQRGRITDRDSRHHGLLAAGIVYNQVGEYRLGAGYAAEVLADQPNGRSGCVAGNLQLESKLGLKDTPTEPVLRAAIQRCDDQGEPILTGASRTYLARQWFADGRVRDAIGLLQKHLPDVEATRYPRLIGEYHALLGQYRMALGDAAGAEVNARKAIEQSAALASSEPLVVAYRTLYDAAQERGDTATALARYRQFADADKAYLTDVKSREMAYQIVRQQSLQQTQQIELLDQKNRVLELQQHLAAQDAQTTRLLVLLMLVVMASVIFWGIRTKRTQLSMRRMAESDALTTISNRHHFSTQSEATLVQSARDGEDVALLMFDLDHFKSINDRFGHDTGDWVLRRVAETCKNFCRRIDFLGRLGGEEFAILLAGCDLRGANRVAEDCRVRIASIDTTPSGHKFVVTASFGVTATSLSGYDLAKLLSHADMMLYRAKRAGRNRVCMYDGDVAATPFLQPSGRCEDRGVDQADQADPASIPRAVDV